MVCPMEPERKRVGAPLHGEVPKARKSFTVDPALWEAAIAKAETRRESLSGIISQRLSDYVSGIEPGVADSPPTASLPSAQG